MQWLLQLGNASLAQTLTKGSFHLHLGGTTYKPWLLPSVSCGLPGAYDTLLLSYLPGGPWRYIHCTLLSQLCGETYVPKPAPL